MLSHALWFDAAETASTVVPMATDGAKSMVYMGYAGAALAVFGVYRCVQGKGGEGDEAGEFAGLLARPGEQDSCAALHGSEAL